MFKKYILFLSVFSLGACAYAIDDSIQDVKFETPGAKNAACIVEVEKLKYSVKPPQTINLFKSRHGFDVDCRAPGYRRIKAHIDPMIEKSTYLNAANGGAGLPWDFVSNAMFGYPDTVVIDFTNVALQPSPLPAHNSPDIKQPEEYYLEEFRPSVPYMNSDRFETKVELQKRERTVRVYQTEDVFSEPANIRGKGDLMNVIDNVIDTNPAGAPTPIIPGE